MCPFEHSSPIEMFSTKNYFDEPQNTTFKRTIINFIKEFREFKEDTKKHLNEIKENILKERKKCQHDAQETTNIKLAETDKNPGLCNFIYEI